MDQPTEQFSQEIRDLEAKLEQKKRELAQAGVEKPERDIFRNVVREHTRLDSARQAGHEVRRVDFTGAGSPPAATPTSTNKTTVQDEEEINLLIQHSFSHGIRSAVSEARKTKNPYFIDTLHDRLADEYYQKLIDARKLISE